MYSSLKLIVLIVSGVILSVNAQHREGDSCTIQSLSINGVCKLISSCPLALELLQEHRIFPQLCGSKKTTPIVCCPDNSFTVPNTTRTTISRETSTPITKEIPLKEVDDTPRSDDFCTIRSLGINGKCTSITFCPSAIKLLKERNIFPQTCGFKNNYPMVCCANESFSTTTNNIQFSITTRRIPTTTTKEVQIIQTFPAISNRTENLNIGDKSRQKCQEYGQYVFVDPMIDVVPGRDRPPLMADCALISIENILGGTNARPKEFPHMALIGYETRFEIHWGCGGSLISEKFVLSAAHCIHLEEFGSAKHVLLGDLDLNSNNDDADPQMISIKRSIAHFDYVPASLYNDIALIELKRNVIFSPYVRPACLNTNPNPTNEFGEATGWGESSNLKKVNLDMFSNSECAYTYRTIKNKRLERGIDNEIQICAGSRRESKDTCQGDSGGPLQIRNFEVFCTHLILGITSFGKDCGLINTPAVYTRVSAYIKWIEDIVWP